MRRALLILPLLAACGTPQERCINGVTRDLRVVDSLIATSEGNLNRGYALEEVTVTRTVWVACPVPVTTAGVDGTNPPPLPQPRLCLDDVSDTETRPKAINLSTEAETLTSLRVKRADLVRQAGPAIAQCRVQFPEG